MIFPFLGHISHDVRDQCHMIVIETVRYVIVNHATVNHASLVTVNHVTVNHVIVSLVIVSPENPVSPENHAIENCVIGRQDVTSKRLSTTIDAMIATGRAGNTQTDTRHTRQTRTTPPHATPPYTTHRLRMGKIWNFIRIEYPRNFENEYSVASNSIRILNTVEMSCRDAASSHSHRHRSVPESSAS